VLLLVAIFLGVFVVPGWWGIAAVLVAVACEAAEKVFWFRYSRRGPIAVGAEAMIGASACVVADCAPRGLVRFRGELWRARCVERALAGELVRIGRVGRDLTLDVAPKR
jgi:membrane protein implicated in regulation of membrane protease activity